MSNVPSESHGPLSGSPFRIESPLDLEEFLTEPDAADLVRVASFEEVFFTIKHLGLGDCLELLPLVSGKQARGCIDLDCWLKDEFLAKPFMEWMAAFVQAGPEEAVRVLSTIDDAVVSLFLKDVLLVYEVDRDDPPDGPNLIFTPDDRFAVELIDDGDGAAMAAQLLDALFKYNPKLGVRLLSNVRYTTRLTLEEDAFDNKNRRLEAQGFVDYYEALSIYGGPETGGVSASRGKPAEPIPGEEFPGALPAVFVDSLSGGAYLREAFGRITDPAETNRLAQELTALGNRILSANLVNLGEVEHVSPALEEMRDTLTIGMEILTGGRVDLAGEVLRASYVQTVFKTGFDRLARLREKAHAMARIPRFVPAMLDSDDREFLEALRHFKPLLAMAATPSKPPRNFRAVAEVEAAEARLAAMEAMTQAFLATFPLIADSFLKTFNTAALQRAAGGPFEPAPLDPRTVEVFLAPGFSLPLIDIPAALVPFAERWIAAMRAELEPLRGQRIDPRFIGTVIVKL